LPLSPAHEREQQSAATEHDPPMGRQLVHAHAPPPVTARHAAPAVHPLEQLPQRHADALDVPHAVRASPAAHRPLLQQPPLQRQSKEHDVVHCPVGPHAWPTGQSRPVVLLHRRPVSTGAPASRRAVTQSPRSHPYPSATRQSVSPTHCRRHT